MDRGAETIDDLAERRSVLRRSGRVWIRSLLAAAALTAAVLALPG
jgi:hypothetical protein